ncbi:MAG: hemolysin family protein [Methanoregulaceae archaeon]
MAAEPLTGLLVIGILIGLNAFFSLAHSVFIASKRMRLELLAGKGNQGAATALELLDDPNMFLSTIQVATTFIWILTGAYSGIALGGYLAPSIGAVPALAPYATVISVALVIVATTFLSLLFGELVPKRIGLDNPEYIASRVARPLRAISVAVLPFVRILTATTEGILKASGRKRPEPAGISEEEIWQILSEGARAGVIEKEEEAMVNAIFRLGDRKVLSLMTPRPDIIGIDLDLPVNSSIKTILSSNHSFLPVYRGELDTLSGVIWVRDLWAQMIEGGSADIALILREPIFIAETAPALQLMELLKTSPTPIALAIDEFGVITGIITVHDIMKAIIGDIGISGISHDRELIRRENGSFLVDGLYPLDEVKDFIGISMLPGEQEGLYHTLAGFVMTELGRIPDTGDVVEWNNYRFEVVDMDGNRVDKILVTPRSSVKQPEAGSTDGV